MRFEVKYFNKTVFEIPKVWGQSETWINSNIKKIHGLSSFESYLSNKNSLIIVIPHIELGIAGIMDLCTDKDDIHLRATKIKTLNS